MTTVPLSKALKTHDGEVKELKLRDIDAGDIVDMKQSPFQVIRREGGEVELLVKYDVSMKYLSRLSGVDDLILRGLSAPDFQRACSAVGALWNGLGE
jgi:hypothetical protein